MKIKVTLCLNIIASIPFDPYLGGQCNRMEFELNLGDELTRTQCLEKLSTWINIIDITVLAVKPDGVVTELDARRITKERKTIVDSAIASVSKGLRMNDVSTPIGFKHVVQKDFETLFSFEATELEILP